MHNDLENHKDLIATNPIIQAISGDASASNEIPDDIVDYDFDKNLNPVEMFQVVDADSSQQDAILWAKRDISFILQGPPGTGKSQTITNIIAECLADGKKVLFVSEKMAALEVVHRRLTSAGLDDFCLILHNYRANKRSVLDQLSNVFSLAQKKATLSNEAYNKLLLLQEDKQKLNEYAYQVFDVVSPLDKSIYEVNGLLANLEAYEEVRFSLKNVELTSNQQYNRYNYLLSQFSDTIGKMSDDYLNNPWYGANMPAVTNELRHDINAVLGNLIFKIESASQEISDILHDLSLKWNLSYDAVVDLGPFLNIAKQSPIVPVSWIWSDDLISFFDEITQYETLRSDLERIKSKNETLKSEFLGKRAELNEFYQKISRNDPSIEIVCIDDLIQSKNVSDELSRMRNILLSTFPYSNWKKEGSKVLTIYDEAVDKVKKIEEIVSKLSLEFEDGIFDIDYNDIFSRYKTEYTSFFKIFNSSYKVDKKKVQSQYKTRVTKVTDEMVLNVIAMLRSIENLRQWFSLENKSNLNFYFGDLLIDEKADFSRIEKYFSAYAAMNRCTKVLNDMLSLSNEIELVENEIERFENKMDLFEVDAEKHFQFLYEGLDTEWGQVRSALTWAATFREEIQKNQCNKEFVELICSTAEHIKMTEAAAQRITAFINDVDTDLKWYFSLFSEPNKIRHLSLPALQNKLFSCMNGLSLLEEWIDFRTAREHCCEEGLSDYIDKIEILHIDTGRIIPIFKKRFLNLWLDAILPKYPAVLNFRRRKHENTINEFATLDKMQFEIAKARIKSKLINDLPSPERFTRGVDEISILRRELNKKRRIMPIRRLFKAIPHLLLTLKPCLMMSPLSVSLFLEAETYRFDTVIFDEASQVCTENAIGAILRGKQVIIAGDSKQLPPTNFFTASVSSDDDYDTFDDDEDDEMDAFESVLDEANFLPERTLLWHYRSKHEHLIAFSNTKIYKNNMITFPSNMDKIADHGVEYVYVGDGYYDRGGKKGNVIEAKKVAEMVFEHMRTYPNRSLGVIAFGSVQQLAIDAALREMRLRNQQYEHFFKEDIDEPFFIKNLENVQGDERDTIIFSIGYAKDAAGIFRMNFGPLSRSGGERRLNVAITRAKYNVKLVGSIMPSDIDLDRVSSEGPKLLRSYIDFAINGVESLLRETTESDIAEHDSPFEAAVYNFLDRKGYKLATQVGCSGYRIDMAVKHPTLNGIYVLGIECDGAAYHSARTARERDRLRQEVLEKMGWKIYRIWSTDWIKDSITEGKKLISAIKDVIANYGIIEEPADDDIEARLNSDEDLNSDENLNSDDDLNSDEYNSDKYVSFYKKSSAVDKMNPYGFARAIPSGLSLLSDSGYFKNEDKIMLLVNEQFPLHYELLCQQLAPFYGNEKATVKIKREVDYGLWKLGTQVIRKGDFLFPAGYSKITVRVPNTRKINHISIEEFAAAMYEILSQRVGIDREGVCAETSRVYFGRSGKNISMAMNDAFDWLISRGRVEEVDGKLRIVE